MVAVALAPGVSGPAYHAVTLPVTLWMGGGRDGRGGAGRVGAGGGGYAFAPLALRAGVV